MKFTTLASMIVATQAVKIQSEEAYNLYWEVADRNKPPMFDVVKRGDSRDFADANVEMAMKANPSSGTWPITPVKFEPFAPKPEPKPHYWKQPWEFVVKKGNSGFNDVQVDKALKLIKEPIVLGGKAVAAGAPPMDHSW